MNLRQIVSGTRPLRPDRLGRLRAGLEAYRHPELAQGLDGCGNFAPVISSEWRRSRAARGRGQRWPAGVIDTMDQDRPQQSVFHSIRGDEPRPDEKLQLHDGVEAHAPRLRIDLAVRQSNEQRLKALRPRASGLRAGHEGRPDAIQGRFGHNRALEMLIEPAADPRIITTIGDQFLRRSPPSANEALPAASCKGRRCRRSLNDHRQSCAASLRRSRKRATFTMGRRRTRARRQAGFRRDCQLFLRRALVRFASLAETNRAPANTCIEGLIETRRSVVHRRSPAPAKTGDPLEPRLAIVGDQDPACRI